MGKASYICGRQDTLILDKTKTKRRLDSKRLSSCKQLRGICDAVIELPRSPATKVYEIKNLGNGDISEVLLWNKFT